VVQCLNLAHTPLVMAALVKRASFSTTERILCPPCPSCSTYCESSSAAYGWQPAGVVAAFLMAITIIGLPCARAAVKIASYTLLPFGQKGVSRANYLGSEDIGTGRLGVLGNIVWLLLAGWWLALGHLITAIPLAVIMIGIPFAWAHLKLAGIALWPIGEMMSAEDAPLRYPRRR